MGRSFNEPLLSTSEHGRVFSIRKKIRIPDTTPEGSFRLDAVARIVSEVSEDDLIDLKRPNTHWWIARKITIDVLSEVVGHQTLDCRTWAGGMAHVAAERRVSLMNSAEGHGRYEAATIWIAIDAKSKRPAALPKWFISEYGAAGTRPPLSVALKHQGLPGGADLISWPLRQVDFDQHRHVNNGSYWPVLEEMMARYKFDRTLPYRAEIEFRTGIPMVDSVDVFVTRYEGQLSIWWQVGDDIAASAIVQHRSSELAL